MLNELKKVGMDDVQLTGSEAITLINSLEHLLTLLDLSLCVPAAELYEGGELEDVGAVESDRRLLAEVFKKEFVCIEPSR